MEIDDRQEVRQVFDDSSNAEHRVSQTTCYLLIYCVLKPFSSDSLPGPVPAQLAGDHVARSGYATLTYNWNPNHWAAEISCEGSSLE